MKSFIENTSEFVYPFVRGYFLPGSIATTAIPSIIEGETGDAILLGFVAIGSRLAFQAIDRIADWAYNRFELSQFESLISLDRALRVISASALGILMIYSAGVRTLDVLK